MKREAVRFRTFELWHDADNISGCFECDSSSNMCFGCSKEPSHRNGETVLLSTQDKCLLLRNQVIWHLRILIWRSGYFFSCTFSKKILQWRQRTVEAHCLKFWNLFCKPIPMRRRICISMLCCRLLYWPKTCSEVADGIINSSDVYAQLSSGTRDIFVTSFFSHTSTSMRRRASKILDAMLQGQE